MFREAQATTHAAPPEFRGCAGAADFGVRSEPPLSASPVHTRGAFRFTKAVDATVQVAMGRSARNGSAGLRSDGNDGLPRTLAIDIGGTGLKALVLDRVGTAVTERFRVETPRPATPRAVLAALAGLVAQLKPFDRISAGFPGVVSAGVVKTAPNLHPSWAGVALDKRLERTFHKPARVLNDAGVQGFGVIKGKGLEMLLTLGTGLGCALFYEGTYIPNLELAHHPFKKGRTYEEHLGELALMRDGKKKWNRHLADAIAVIDPIWNPDRIYLGGGNTKYVTVDLPAHVRLTPNVAGLLGGIALWEGRASIGNLRTARRLAVGQSNRRPSERARVAAGAAEPGSSRG